VVSRRISPECSFMILVVLAFITISNQMRREGVAMDSERANESGDASNDWRQEQSALLHNERQPELTRH
jgi:hypothetical protein